MGLDVSHGCWHGAYGAFHRFRELIADAIGLPLNYMQGFYNSAKPDYRNMGMVCAIELDSSKVIDPNVGLPFTTIPGQDYMGVAMVKELVTLNKYLPLKWDMLKPDPIYEFLYHSDCGGKLGRRAQKRIAKRLREIAPLLPTEGGGHLPNPQAAAIKFAEGLELAYANREIVEFY